MLLSGTADAASMANVLKAYKTTSQWQEAGQRGCSKESGTWSIIYTVQRYWGLPAAYFYFTFEKISLNHFRWCNTSDPQSSIPISACVQACWHLFEVPSAFQLVPWTDMVQGQITCGAPLAAAKLRKLRGSTTSPWRKPVAWWVFGNERCHCYGPHGRCRWSTAAVLLLAPVKTPSYWQADGLVWVISFSVIHIIRARILICSPWDLFPPQIRPPASILEEMRISSPPPTESLHHSLLAQGRKRRMACGIVLWHSMLSGSNRTRSLQRPKQRGIFGMPICVVFYDIKKSQE